jgi:hypothetical protein
MRAPATSSAVAKVPIELRRPNLPSHFGGVEFKDCYVYNNVHRPGLRVEEDSSESGVREVHGLITVQNRSGARMRLGHAPVDADVLVAPANPPELPAGKPKEISLGGSGRRLSGALRSPVRRGSE